MYKSLILFSTLFLFLVIDGNSYYQKRPDVVIEFDEGYTQMPWNGPGLYYSIWFSDEYQYNRWCRRHYRRGYYGPRYYESGPWGTKRGYYYGRDGWNHERNRDYRESQRNSEGRGRLEGGDRGGPGRR